MEDKIEKHNKDMNQLIEELKKAYKSIAELKKENEELKKKLQSKGAV